MALKITEYPAKTVFNDGDLYDVSSFDGVSAYNSEKMTFSQLKSQLNLDLVNIYNSDGVLSGSRDVDCDGNNLTFSDAGVISMFADGSYTFDNNSTVSFKIARVGDTMFNFNASSEFNPSLTIGDVAANSSAQLNLGSSFGGLLMARLTAVALNAITPVNGLIVYAIETTATFTSLGFWYYEEGSWIKL